MPRPVETFAAVRELSEGAAIADELDRWYDDEEAQQAQAQADIDIANARIAELEEELAREREHRDALLERNYQLIMNGGAVVDGDESAVAEAAEAIAKAAEEAGEAADEVKELAEMDLSPVSRSEEWRRD